MNTVRAVFIFGFLVISLAADATVVLGPGAASCGTWAADRQRNEARSVLNQAWVQGFVTAYNVYGPTRDGMSRPMEPRALIVWVDNYCDANPQKDIYDAARALVEDPDGRAQQ